MSENHDYKMERRLRELNPELHRRFTDAVFALQFNLSNYKLIFPTFTDHTMLHSLSVIDFCNQLIGDQIEKLNVDELYILLMAAYFHDTGMGITKKDYEEFASTIDFGDFFDDHDKEDLPAAIRGFHHEFSGRFIKKYAELFEIPNEEYTWAIVQVARGHRRTNLLDEKEYPTAYLLPSGNTVCLPYLAALIRLADEIDVAASRNTILLYDLEGITDDHEIVENKKLKAVRQLGIDEDAFTLYVDECEPRIMDAVIKVSEKMQKTLDGCREVVLERTPYTITQSKVMIEK